MNGDTIRPFAQDTYLELSFTPFFPSYSHPIQRGVLTTCLRSHSESGRASHPTPLTSPSKLCEDLAQTCDPFLVGVPTALSALSSPHGHRSTHRDQSSPMKTPANGVTLASGPPGASLDALTSKVLTEALKAHGSSALAISLIPCHSGLRHMATLASLSLLGAC